MKKKKTKGQIEWERAQRNLRNRLKTVEKNGYDVAQTIKDLATTDYNTITPQLAYRLRKEMQFYRGEVLRRPSMQQTTIELFGNNRRIEYIEEKLLTSKAIEMAEKKAQEKADKTKSEVRKYAERQDKIWQRTKNANDTDYIREHEKLLKWDKQRQTEQGVANFFNAYRTRTTDKWLTGSEYRLWNVMMFLSKLETWKVGSFIEWMDNNYLDLLVYIYDSDQHPGIGFDEDDLREVEEELHRLYGYTIVPDSLAENKKTYGRYSGSAGKIGM